MSFIPCLKQATIIFLQMSVLLLNPSRTLSRIYATVRCMKAIKLNLKPPGKQYSLSF
jgi:hypothetical protein